MSETGGGLTAGIDYFINNFQVDQDGNAWYRFYTSAEDAAAGTLTERVDLTGDIEDIIAGFTEINVHENNQHTTERAFMPS